MTGIFLSTEFNPLQKPRARISLADPDPSAVGKELPKHKKSTVEGESEVVFTKEDVRPRKKKKIDKKIEAKIEL